MRPLPLLVLLAACASATPAPVGPESTVQAWADGLRAKDAEAIWALLDPATRQRVSVGEVARLLEQNEAELHARAEQLAVVEDLESRAVVPLPSGEQAVLMLEGGEWRLVGGVLGAPALTTPEDAVRALRRALARGRADGVLELLARAPRAALRAEIARFLADTEDELDWETTVQGNEARVQTSGARVIRLVREAGEWRIVDVQ